MSYNPITGRYVYNPSPLSQFDNIAAITANAMRYIASKPNVDFGSLIVQVDSLLIPDWSRNIDYDSPEYAALVLDFMHALEAQLAESSPFINYLAGVLQVNPAIMRIRDSYLYFSDAEKAYLHELKGRGSIADIIKNQAIGENIGEHHLQIDSNTLINNPMALFDSILGESTGIDALNASLYDPLKTYVSPHNKIVYTAPGSEFAQILKDSQEEYCAAHADDQADKAADKNSIYSKVFMPATQSVGLTNIVSIDYDGERKNRYAADLERHEYRITPFIVTSVNGSWAADGDQDPPEIQELKKISLDVPSFYGAGAYDAQNFVKFDFGAFTNALSKYSCNLATGDTALFKSTVTVNFVNPAISLYARKIMAEYPHLWATIAQQLTGVPMPDKEVGEILPGLTANDMYLLKR